MNIFLTKVFLTIIFINDCYSAAIVGSVLGQLKASTHIVSEVSLSRHFRKSSAEKALVFKTLERINELSQKYDELVSEIFQHDDIDVGLQALETVLLEMLKDGCNWAKSNFKANSLNCTDPQKSLRQINLMAKVHLTAESLYDTLGDYKHQPTEDYEDWVKTRIVCDEAVTDSVAGFVVDNHTPFLRIRGKSRTTACK